MGGSLTKEPSSMSIALDGGPMAETVDGSVVGSVGFLVFALLLWGCGGDVPVGRCYYC